MSMVQYLYIAVLSCFLILGGGSSSWAVEESPLLIRVTLLQCGARVKIEKSCKRDERCCVFLDSESSQMELALADRSDDKRKNVR